jgi:hypothetical protein
VRGRDVHAELGHQARQPRRLALRQVEDQPSERRGVDDRVLERTLQSPTDEPGVEGVVAVLDQDRALGEAKKRAARVPELGRADQHRAVDVVALARVGVDRRPAVDQGVEERERGVEAKPLGADLEDEKRGVAGRLDVEGDELRVVQGRRAADLGRVDCDLLPRHGLARAARFEEDRAGAHERAMASARRAQRISSPVRPRRSSTAAA